MGGLSPVDSGSGPSPADHSTSSARQALPDALTSAGALLPSPSCPHHGFGSHLCRVAGLSSCAAGCRPRTPGGTDQWAFPVVLTTARALPTCLLLLPPCLPLGFLGWQTPGPWLLCAWDRMWGTDRGRFGPTASTTFPHLQNSPGSASTDVTGNFALPACIQRRKPGGHSPLPGKPFSDHLLRPKHY